MMRALLSPIRAIAKVTFFELLRDKVLYNTVLFSILLMAVGYLSSKLMTLRPERMLLDFGYSAVLISMQLVALFLGAGLVSKEFERRTVFLTLSRPVSRAQFLMGKYFGLCILLILNGVLLISSYLLILYYVAGAQYVDVFTTTLAWGLLFSFLQSFWVGAIVILFSTFATVSLSVLYTAGLLIVGNNISNLKLVAQKIEVPAVKEMVETVSYILPNFEFFQLGTKLTYGFALNSTYIQNTILYGLFQIIFTLLLASFVIHRKES